MRKLAAAKRNRIPVKKKQVQVKPNQAPVRRKRKNNQVIQMLETSENVLNYVYVE